MRKRVAWFRPIGRKYAARFDTDHPPFTDETQAMRAPQASKALQGAGQKETRR